MKNYLQKEFLSKKVYGKLCKKRSRKTFFFFFKLSLLFICLPVSYAQITPTISVGNVLPLPQDYFGLNGSNTWNNPNGWLNSCIATEFPYLNFGNARFPGGTVSNWFNWFTGKGQHMLENGFTLPSEYKVPNFLPSAINTLDNYALGVGQKGPKTIFCLNLLTSNYHDQKAGIFHAKGLDLPLGGIELGNEFYLGINSKEPNTLRFPTAKAYADSCNSFIAKLNAKFPGTRIGVVGVDKTVQTNEDVERINGWLSGVSSNLNTGTANVAITIHPYTGTSIANSELNCSDLDSLLSAPFRKMADLIANELSIISAAGKKAWFTEYNLLSSSRNIAGRWAHGLFVAAQTLSFMDSETVELIDTHSLLGKGNFATFFEDSLGLDMPPGWNDNYMEADASLREDAIDTETLKTYPCQKTAIGNAIAPIATALKGITKKRKITFSGSMPTPLVDKDGFTYPSLVGYKFQNNLSYYTAVIINLSSSPVTISPLAILGTNGGRWEQITANPLDFIIGNAYSYTTTLTGCAMPMNHLPRKITGSNIPSTLELLPYSIISFNTNYFTGPSLNTNNKIICGNNTATCIVAAPGPYTWTVTPASAVTVTNLGDRLELKANNITQTTNVEVKINTPQGFDRDTITFRVAPVAKIRLGTGAVDAGFEQTICNGATQQLNVDLTFVNNTSLSDDKFAWYPSKDVNLPDNKTVIITPTQEVTTYYLYATDGICWNAMDSITLKMKAFVNAGVDKSFCLNNLGTPSVTIGTPATGLFPNNTYAWSPTVGIVGSTTSATAVIDPTATGTYTYTLTVDNNLPTNCAAKTDVVVVKVNDCCTSSAASLTMYPDSGIAQLKKGINTQYGLGNPYIAGNLIKNVPADIVINGDFHINQETIFKNCTIKLSENAKIIIDNHKEATLDSCILDACTTKMWETILAPTALTRLFIKNITQIKNGIAGVTILQNAQHEITNSIFDMNYEHIRLQNHTYAFTNHIYSNSLLHTGGVLLAPKNTGANNNKTLNGIYLNGNKQAIAIGKGTSAANRNYFRNNVNGIYSWDAAIIQNNQISNSVTNGIYISTGTDPIGALIQNNFIDTSGIGIQTFKTSNATILNNKIFTTQEGIRYLGYDGVNKYDIQNNTIYKFKYGINGVPYNLTSSVTIKGNKLQARYYVPGNANFESTAIYSARTSALTPTLFLVDSNSIDSCQFGVYISKINKVKISNNTILMRKPATGTIYNHYGLYMLESNNDTIKVNTIKTNNGTFTNLSVADRGKYTGAFLQIFQFGSITDNDVSNAAKHFHLSNNVQNNRFSCNFFSRGLPAADTTHTNTFYLDYVTISQFGLSTGAADNYWQTDFPTALNAWNFRFEKVGATPTIAYYYRGTDVPGNQYRPKPYNGTTLNPFANIDTSTFCYRGTGGVNAMILQSNDLEAEHGNADVTKSGEGDSTLVEIIENYQPVFESTSTVSDFFTDLANYNAGLAYAAEGLTDSTLIENNYQGTLIEDIIDLDIAMNENDSTTARHIISALPRGKDVLDNIVKVTTIQLENDILNHADSINLEILCMTRVDEGGAAVITARNLLNRYVDESLLPETPNKALKNKRIVSFSASIYPNPSKGELVIVTNSDALLELKMFDITGKMVYENKTIKNQTLLNLAGFTSGLYSINLHDISNQRNFKTFKWVISK
jgi:Secretion system C-terminal sorting domain